MAPQLSPAGMLSEWTRSVKTDVSRPPARPAVGRPALPGVGLGAGPPGPGKILSSWPSTSSSRSTSSDRGRALELVHRARVDDGAATTGRVSSHASATSAGRSPSSRQSASRLSRVSRNHSAAPRITTRPVDRRPHRPNHREGHRRAGSTAGGRGRTPRAGTTSSSTIRVLRFRGSARTPGRTSRRRRAASLAAAMCQPARMELPT